MFYSVFIFCFCVFELFEEIWKLKIIIFANRFTEVMLNLIWFYIHYSIQILFFFKASSCKFCINAKKKEYFYLVFFVAFVAPSAPHHFTSPQWKANIGWLLHLECHPLFSVFFSFSASFSLLLSFVFGKERKNINTHRPLVFLLKKIFIVIGSFSNL